MNKLMVIIFALLCFLIGISEAQTIYALPNASVRVTLTNVSDDTIFVVKPSAGPLYLGLVPPTNFSATRTATFDPVKAFSFECNASTGMAAGETDSLQVKIIPIVKDYQAGSYTYAVPNAVWAKGDVPASVTTTVTTIDWTDTYTYLCVLNSDDEDNYWRDRVIGLAIVVSQFDGQAGIGIYDFNFLF